MRSGSSTAAAERRSTPLPALEEPGGGTFSPNSNPFGDRPTARTPQGMHALASAGKADDGEGWLLSSAGGGGATGQTTPRLSWTDLPSATTKLSARPTPAGNADTKLQASRAAKWLHSMSPASKAAVKPQAGQKVSPTQPAAAAAAVALTLAAVAVSPRRSTSPAAAGGVGSGSPAAAPTPASVFPRSHPIKSRAQAVPVAALTPQQSGLSSWLRMSSHLSKPPTGEDPDSPAGSSSGSDVDSGDSASRTRSALDFDAVDSSAPAEAKGEAKVAQALPSPARAAAPQETAAKAAPAAAAVVVAAVAAAAVASPRPTITMTAISAPPAAQLKPAQPAVPAEICCSGGSAKAAGPAVPAATVSKPAPSSASAARKQAGATRGSSRSRLLRAVLALCLLAGLLAAPMALTHFAPVTARHPALASAATHVERLASCAAQQASQLQAALQHHAQQVQLRGSEAFVAGTARARQLSGHAARQAGQLQAAWQQRSRLALSRAQQAFVDTYAVAQARLTATVAAARSAASGTAVLTLGAQQADKPAATKLPAPTRKPELRQAVPSSGPHPQPSQPQPAAASRPVKPAPAQVPAVSKTQQPSSAAPVANKVPVAKTQPITRPATAPARTSDAAAPLPKRQQLPPPSPSPVPVRRPPSLPPVASLPPQPALTSRLSAAAASAKAALASRAGAAATTAPATTVAPSAAISTHQPSQSLGSWLAAAVSGAKAAVASWVSTTTSRSRPVQAGTNSAWAPALPALLRTHLASSWQGAWRQLQAHLPTAATLTKLAPAAAAAPVPPPTQAQRAAAALRAAVQRLEGLPTAALVAGVCAVLASALGIVVVMMRASQVAVKVPAEEDGAVHAAYPSTTPAVGGRTQRRQQAPEQMQTALDAQEFATPQTPARQRGRSVRVTSAAAAAEPAPRSTRRAATASLATPATARRRSTRLVLAP